MFTKKIGDIMSIAKAAASLLGSQQSSYGAMEMQNFSVENQRSKTETLASPLIVAAGKQQISLQEIWNDPVKCKSYVKALACRAALNSLDSAYGGIKSLAALILGVWESGILNSPTVSSIKGSFDVAASCDGQPPVSSGTQPFSAPSGGASIKDAIQQALGVSVEVPTFGLAALFLLSHASHSRIRTYLSQLEKTHIQTILGSQNNESPSRPPETKFSWASWALDFLLPFLLDASQYALLIKTIENPDGYLSIPVGQTIPWIQQENGFTVAGTATLASVRSEMVPGQLVVSSGALWGLWALGVASYLLQASFNFLHDSALKKREPSQVAQRTPSNCNYPRALACRAAGKVSRALHEMARNSAMLMAWLQVSGVLNGEVGNALQGIFGMNASCPGHDPLSFNQSLTFPSLSQKLGDILNLRLNLPIDTMTLAAIGAWFISERLCPPFEQFCLRQEQRLLTVSENASVQPAAQAEETSRITKALTRFCDAMDYFEPFLLDATLLSLLTQAAQAEKDSFAIPSENPQTWDFGSVDQLFVQIKAGITDLVISMTSGDSPIPEELLYFSLAVGIAMYLAKAFRNFHQDLRARAAVQSSVETEVLSDVHVAGASDDADSVQSQESRASLSPTQSSDESGSSTASALSQSQGSRTSSSSSCQEVDDETVAAPSLNSLAREPRTGLFGLPVPPFIQKLHDHVDALNSLEVERRNYEEALVNITEQRRDLEQAIETRYRKLEDTLNKLESEKPSSAALA
jgi:hypothetical protein